MFDHVLAALAGGGVYAESPLLDDLVEQARFDTRGGRGRLFLSRRFHHAPPEGLPAPPPASSSALSLLRFPSSLRVAKRISSSFSLLCTLPRRSASWPRSSSRSEEHTSELQSQSNLVCRLLLEKKN